MPPRLKYIFDIVKCPDWKAFWIFGHGYVISIFQTLSHSCMVEARSIESVCTSSLLKSMKKVKDSLWELKYWLLLIMPIPGLCYPKPCRRLRVQQRLSLFSQSVFQGASTERAGRWPARPAAKCIMITDWISDAAPNSISNTGCPKNRAQNADSVWKHTFTMGI